MTFSFTQEVPIGPDTYAEIKEKLGPDVPDGFITHLAYRTDAGLRYVDVWRSKEDWQRFVEDRLHPVVDEVVTRALGFSPPEPEMTMLDVIDAWVGPASAAAA